jgi:hypothetical protein
MNFITTKQYEFDKYLFDYIKTFLFTQKREYWAILNLKYESKYKIKNQKKYGLYIHNKNFGNYTDNEIIEIRPSILDLSVTTDKVFINYTTRNKVYICDIYDNTKDKDMLCTISTYTVQLNGSIIETFDVHNSTYLFKTNKKLATIYLDKKYGYLIQNISKKYNPRYDTPILHIYKEPIYKNLNEEEMTELRKKLHFR